MRKTGNYIISNQVRCVVVSFTSAAMELMGRGKRAQTCTCRVACSSFPVGEGVPSSSDAGVTGEEAMFSPDSLTL